MLLIRKLIKKEENWMREQKSFTSFYYYGFHKGFYDDEDPSQSLNTIEYSDFFPKPNDDDFPYDTANTLLSGACHLFALSLSKLLKYNAYIIEEKNKKGFHVFCQVYKNKEWYYIDARGITTSFDEFMDIARNFVHDEYIIRPVSDNDIIEWNNDYYYDKEALAFAEAIIKKYNNYYAV